MFQKKKIWLTEFLFIIIAAVLACAINTNANASPKGCLSCHHGIANIKNPDSPMMLQIKSIGVKVGDPQGCVVCHGGNPGATIKEAAHKGA